MPPGMVDWMDLHSATLFLSAVTVAEIEDRIAKLRREGASRKNVDLTAWLETVLSRNLRHFDPLDVAAIDPFAKLLPS
jgi:toxin FitB